MIILSIGSFHSNICISWPEINWHITGSHSRYTWVDFYKASWNEYYCGSISMKSSVFLWEITNSMKWNLIDWFWSTTDLIWFWKVSTNMYRFLIFLFLKFGHSEKDIKVWNNLPLDLTCTKQTSNHVGDCFKFCGLLWKFELYFS